MRRAALAALALAIGCTPQPPSGSTSGQPVTGPSAPSAAAPPSAAPAPPPSPEVQALAAMVRRKDYTSITRAKEIGAPAVPTLGALARDPEPDVRSLAVACLAVIGGPAAEAFVIDDLLDPVDDVRASAYQALYHHGASRASLPALLAAYARSADERVRHAIALVVGRIDGATAADLAPRCAGETDPLASAGCTAALAKLGDSSARAALERQLYMLGVAATPAREKLQAAFRDVEYVGQPWILKALANHLGNRELLVHLFDNPIPGTPYMLRVCDVAVNLIAAISKHGFSFPVDGHTNYSEPALAEVRRYLDTLPP